MELIAKDTDGTIHKLTYETGDILMHILRDGGLELIGECGGCCSCATCHVYLEEGWFAKSGQLSIMEQVMLDMALDPTENSRLSCQIILGPDHDGMALTVAPPWL